MLPSEIQHIESVARLKQMERDCRAVCGYCNKGFDCFVDEAGNWRHPDNENDAPLCVANAIRRAFEEQT